MELYCTSNCFDMIILLVAELEVSLGMTGSSTILVLFAPGCNIPYIRGVSLEEHINGKCPSSSALSTLDPLCQVLCASRLRCRMCEGLLKSVLVRLGEN